MENSMIYPFFTWKKKNSISLDHFLSKFSNFFTFSSIHAKGSIQILVIFDYFFTHLYNEIGNSPKEIVVEVWTDVPFLRMLYIDQEASSLPLHQLVLLSLQQL